MKEIASLKGIAGQEQFDCSYIKIKPSVNNSILIL